MKTNMGTADRLIRTAIAIIVALLYFTGTISGMFGIVLLAFAAIFLLTSLVSFCPIYFLFGLSTCAKK